MKKALAIIALVIVVSMCAACVKGTSGNKETTTAESSVTQSVTETTTAAQGETTTAKGETTTAKGGKNGTTLKHIEGGNEITVTLPKDESTTKKKNTTKPTTTKKSSKSRETPILPLN